LGPYPEDSILEISAYSVNQYYSGAYPQDGSGRVVDIRPLKGWVSRNLSASPYLRSMILSDRDELSVEEYLVKIEMWSRLLKEETTRRKNHY
jgi:hypothetical protein